MAEERTKVDAIIKGINDLTDAEKRDLTIAIRTTEEGNKAYVSFLYGVTRAATNPVAEVPTEEPCKITEHSTGNEAENEANNNSENPNNEWL
jgi:hypothetical protein